MSLSKPDTQQSDSDDATAAAAAEYGQLEASSTDVTDPHSTAQEDRGESRAEEGATGGAATGGAALNLFSSDLNNILQELHSAMDTARERQRQLPDDFSTMSREQMIAMKQNCVEDLERIRRLEAEFNRQIDLQQEAITRMADKMIGAVHNDGNKLMEQLHGIKAQRLRRMEDKRLRMLAMMEAINVVRQRGREAIDSESLDDLMVLCPVLEQLNQTSIDDDDDDDDDDLPDQRVSFIPTQDENFGFLSLLNRPADAGNIVGQLVVEDEQPDRPTEDDPTPEVTPPDPTQPSTNQH